MWFHVVWYINTDIPHQCQHLSTTAWHPGTFGHNNENLNSHTRVRHFRYNRVLCVCIIPHTANLGNKKSLYIAYWQVTCSQTSTSRYPSLLLITSNLATATTAVLTAILRERGPSSTIGFESRGSLTCVYTYWARNEYRNFIQSIHNPYIDKWRLPTGSTQTFLLFAYSDLLPFTWLQWVFKF